MALMKIYNDVFCFLKSSCGGDEGDDDGGGGGSGAYTVVKVIINSEGLVTEYKHTERTSSEIIICSVKCLK